jgi:hypothetical protein
MGREDISTTIIEQLNTIDKGVKDKQNNIIFYISSAPGTGKSKILYDMKRYITKM